MKSQQKFIKNNFFVVVNLEKEIFLSKFTVWS